MAVRSAALAFMTLGVIGLSARAASADSINLMQPALLPSILIDASTNLWKRDPELPASVDAACVALKDSQDRARLGSVSWSVGRLTWQWDRAGDQWGVYLVCSDHRSKRELMDRGLAFAAAIAGASRIGATASGAVITNAEAGSELTSDMNPVPVRMPTSIDSIEPNDEFLLSPRSDVLGLGDLYIQPLSLVFEPPIILDTDVVTPFAEFSQPIGLEPADLAAVPEPGTLVLMGTGLAVAWRAARRRR